MAEVSAEKYIHGLTIVALESALRNMAEIMDKAEAHAKEKEIELDVYLQSRLYPDMFTLLQQLQYVSYIACDLAKHFSDEPAPHVGYDESTWRELRQSLDTAADYLRKIPDERVAAHAAKVVPVFFDEAQGMKAAQYAAAVSIPDFFFHMTIAYAILRHNGVPLGKADFLGTLDTVAMG
jgi:hypothetical protein